MSFWEKMKLVMSGILDFLMPFVRQLMSATGPILAAAALTAVQAVASNASGATDSQKRDLAFQAITNDLKQKGIKVGVDIGTSMVNAAIELAVLKMKSIP